MNSIKANLLLASTEEFLPSKCNEETWGKKEMKQQNMVV